MGGRSSAIACTKDYIVLAAPMYNIALYTWNLTFVTEYYIGEIPGVYGDPVAVALGGGANDTIYVVARTNAYVDSLYAIRVIHFEGIIM